MASKKKATPRGAASRARKSTRASGTSAGKGKKTQAKQRKATAAKAPAQPAGKDSSRQMVRRAPRERGSSAISRKLAEDFFKRIREIKSDNPETTRMIDKQERSIHRSLWSIREAIDLMSPQERELVRILVINGIYKAADEILLEDQ